MKEARARVLEVPWVLLQRRGRTELQLNGTVAQATSQPNEGLVTALVRAFQWKDDLVAGKVLTVQALAKREGLDRCYVMRLLRLSFLAPDLIEAILMGWQPPELTLEKFRRPIPVEWELQRTYFGFRPTS